MPKKFSPRLLILVELFVVTAAALVATRDYVRDDPRYTLAGREVEWQVNTAYFAAQGLREEGYIPLWNPWLEHGHPLIDNAQSVVLNPFSSVPSMIWGGRRGILLGVVIAALLAGWGGWFLARTLELGTLGRVLLGCLLIGKGNMLANFGAGYFQLGSAQAYFPWIVAATLMLLRLPEGDRRLRGAVGLLTVSFTLMYWGGSIWYSLPLLLTMALLAIFHFRWITLPVIFRFLLAATFIVGLSAVTLLSLWIQREYLGSHPDDLRGGDAVSITRVIQQFYNGGRALYRDGLAPGAPHFYYSFAAPLWFLALIFGPAPFTWRHRLPGTWRIWAVGGILIVVMTVWGAGGNPLIKWMYRNLPLLAQWRFVGRALAVASFWIAVLVAMRVDGLWQFIWKTEIRSSWIRAGQWVAASILIAASLLAAREVTGKWTSFAELEQTSYWRDDDECISWLRRTHPGENLAVYQYGYEAILTYERNHVRLWNIEADFQPLPLRDTIRTGRVLRTLPEYGMAWSGEERQVLRQFGYLPVMDSPNDPPCLWHRDNVPGYAFGVRPGKLVASTFPLTAEETIPIEDSAVMREPGRVTVRAQSIPEGEHVLMVQELAYPGWQVRVDGKRVRLEVVDGLVGVVLPRGEATYTVEFAYRPPLVLVGGVLSIITALVLMAYLLRADRILVWREVKT